MKTKFLWFALTVSAATIAQANPVAHRGGGAGARGGAVPHPAGGARAGGVARAGGGVRAPIRSGGISSFNRMPARGFGGGMNYPRQRYSSFGMRSYRPNQFRQSSTYPNRVTFTRSGPYIAATIRQPNQ